MKIHKSTYISCAFGGIPRSIQMFCRVTGAFESPRDLTTGRDDIFEEWVFIHETYRNFWQAHEHLKESSWENSSKYQKFKTLPFFFALQPLPWCIYWETQSIGKLGTNIENKGESAMHNNEDGCIAGAWEMTTHGEEKRWGSWEQTWWSIYPRRQK